MKTKFLCPSGDFTCPYYNVNECGVCDLGDDAVNECDDAYYFCYGEDRDADC